MVLAKRAKVPQPTISRVEQGHLEIELSTLKKILEALCCDLVIAPLLHAPIENLKKQQARRKATKQINYLKDPSCYPIFPLSKLRYQPASLCLSPRCSHLASSQILDLGSSPFHREKEGSNLGLKGTMNQPDAKFMEHLLKEEEHRLLEGPNFKLWESSNG